MPAHQRYRYQTITGSVPQFRGPRIGHSIFQTVAPPLLLLYLKPVAHVKQNRNKTKTNFCFVSADQCQSSFISVLFQRVAHVKQNAETTSQ
jgi:hypothetical protein